MALDAGFNCIATDLKEIDTSNTIKMFFFAEPALLQPIYEQLKARYGEQINLTFSLDKCLEVMHADTNKGAAVQTVLADKALLAEHAIAFGDAMNDVEMLNLVAKPVLMANSQQRLRLALPDAEFTLSAKKDGVAVMMDKLLTR